MSTDSDTLASLASLAGGSELGNAAALGSAALLERPGLLSRITDLQAQLAARPAKSPLWGANASDAKAHDALESLLGPLVLWRYYQQPNEPIAFPKEYALATGQVFAYSHKATMADLIAGRHDAELRSLCAEMIRHGGGYVTPGRHEAEDDIERGDFTLADFLKAQDHAIKIIREFPGIKITPILMDFTIRGGKKRNPMDYLPKDFDVLGTDAYVSGIVNGKPFGIPISQAPNIFDATKKLADKLGKPWGAFEVGVGNRVPGQPRLDALQAVSTAARTAGAEVCAYFMDGPASPWAVDAKGAAAWLAGQRG